MLVLMDKHINMGEVKLKGMQQATSDLYNSTSDADKKGYIWFVRDFDENGEYISAKIYVGTRLYADTNDLLHALMEIGGDDVE